MYGIRENPVGQQFARNVIPRYGIKKMKSSQAIKQFELMLRCQTSSRATVENYLSAARSFFNFCTGKSGEPIELLKQYMVWGLSGKTERTINLHRAAVVKFFKVVKGIKISTTDVPRKRQPKQKPVIIDRETINEAISKTFNLKHRIELSLMYGCGLRLSELVNIKRKNIITTSIPWRLFLQHTKGNKYRYIPIPNSCMELLNDFINGMERDEYIFKGEGGIGHISDRSVYNVVVAAFERVGIVAHPHLLRHGYITHQIMSGQNVFKVQAWVGHSSLKSLLPYVHLSESVLSESTDLLNGNYKNVC
jgi:integrase/recombinase XerD